MDPEGSRASDLVVEDCSTLGFCGVIGMEESQVWMDGPFPVPMLPEYGMGIGSGIASWCGSGRAVGVGRAYPREAMFEG